MYQIPVYQISYCYKDIPVGENYYRLISTDTTFCCDKCVTEYLIYSGKLKIETCMGDEN